MPQKDNNNEDPDVKDPFLPPPVVLVVPPYGYGSKLSIYKPNEIDTTQEKCPEPTKEAKTGWRRYIGVIYVLICVNMLALSSTIMKFYSRIHPFNVGVWSSPAPLVFTICVIAYSAIVQKKSITVGLFPLTKHRKNLFFLVLRSFFSSIINYLMIMAFKYITPADMRTVVSAAVIVVYFFGWMCLGEKIGIVPVIVALVAIVGIGIMTRPPVLTGEKDFDKDTLIGIGLSTACMIVVAMNLLIIRYLNAIHHAVTNIFVYIWCFGQGLILAFACGVFEIPTFKDILGLNLGGMCLALGLMFLVLALQVEEAGVVALFKTSEVIFLFFWQMIIIGTKPALISVAGATLIILGVVTVSLRKFVADLPPESKRRKQLKFLLL